MNLDQNSWVESVKNSKKSIVIDVRTIEEFCEGFIEDAIHLNIYDSESFMNGINKLNTNDHIHVYCRSGSRSSQACEIMKQLGLQNVYNLKGGILDWTVKIIKNN